MRYPDLSPRQLEDNPTPLRKGRLAKLDNVVNDDMLIAPGIEIPVRYYGEMGGGYHVYHEYAIDPVTGKYRFKAQHSIRECEFNARKFKHAGFRYDELTWSPPRPLITTKDVTWVDHNGEIRDVENGWLALDGTMYPCEYEGHIEHTRKLVIFGVVPSESYDTERVIECAGWIKLSSGVARGSILSGWISPTRPGSDPYKTSWGTDVEYRGTAAQRRYIQKHCMHFETALPYFLKR